MKMPIIIAGSVFMLALASSRVGADGGMALRDRRIVNGDDADNGDWPWFVSLRSSDTDSHFCGGALHKGDIVITAAHCVTDNRGRVDLPRSITANVGSHTLSDPLSGFAVGVSSITVHPQYDVDTLENDIAILRLSSCVAGVHPIPADTRSEAELFASGAHQVGLAAIIGHGSDGTSGDLVDILQEAEQTVLRHNECEEEFRENEGAVNVIFAATMICGSIDNPNGPGLPNVDTCQGDSGGPFVTRLPDDSFVLTGVTSWGYGCGDTTPGVYARVAHFVGPSGFIETNAFSSCDPNATHSPTTSPPPVNRGRLECGSTISGSTVNAVNTVGQSSGEAHYSFSVTSLGPHTIDACASDYDTWLYIYSDDNNDGIPDNPEAPVYDCDDCGNCVNPTRTRLISGSQFSHLPVGNYVLVIEGYEGNEGGYTVLMTCPGNPTPTTPVPTSSPSPPPASPSCPPGYEDVEVRPSTQFVSSTISSDIEDCEEACANLASCAYFRFRYRDSKCQISDNFEPTRAVANVHRWLMCRVSEPPTSCHQVRCGRVDRCSESDECADDSTRHEVRCCSNTDPGGWRLNAGIGDASCPWTESDDFDAVHAECQHSMTFVEATQFCEAVGARLCTSREADLNCLRGSGCGHDSDLVWTSDGPRSTATCESLGWPSSPLLDDAVCGESNGGWSCELSSTFQRAEQVCELQGARVCSVDELLNRAGWNTGCGLNTLDVWAFDTCTISGTLGRRTVNAGTGSSTCEFMTATSGVRCCADSSVGRAFVPVHGSGVISGSEDNYDNVSSQLELVPQSEDTDVELGGSEHSDSNSQIGASTIIGLVCSFALILIAMAVIVVRARSRRTPIAPKIELSKFGLPSLTATSNVNPIYITRPHYDDVSNPLYDEIDEDHMETTELFGVAN